MRCPQVQIEEDDRKRFLKDPGVLTLEVLFGLLSVGNVLILYYLMSAVIPFPVTVTWFQFAIGLLYARVLGECGQEFPNLAYFVPLRIDWKQMGELAFPTIAFIAMIVFGNIMLSMLPAVALFPVAASFAVCSHHFTRFLGCGQVYRPIRWAALALMLAGFLVSCFDDLSVGARVVPVAVCYAVAAAAYRGCFLEKAMHTVRGLGNNLHNQQTMAGVLLLPLLIAVTRERRFFTYMPDNFARGYTWLMWGCLASAAVLPFVKNIVANRLIKIGGQPPWRVIELASMFCIFLLGFLIFDRVSAVGLVAFLLVFGGRSINSMDALSIEAQQPRHPQYSGPGGPKSRGGPPPQKEPAHGTAQPFLDSDLEAAGGYAGRTPGAGQSDAYVAGKTAIPGHAEGYMMGTPEGAYSAGSPVGSPIGSAGSLGGSGSHPYSPPRGASGGEEGFDDGASPSSVGSGRIGKGAAASPGAGSPAAMSRGSPAISGGSPAISGGSPAFSGGSPVAPPAGPAVSRPIVHDTGDLEVPSGGIAAEKSGGIGIDL
eukprot:Gregarina_sp_Poly_1__5551@NODE_292_length_9900_cov_48_311299_g253_i0_p3_GENE_NODE_292_length_9900_cov_48_311299_g253_i0NODE_292_length_9900_cov_48_311299_g253_i0_p3_ORF_typecomplete_len540_score54_33TPT/PF03151_16/3_9e16PTPS_related/PF10131_9/8_5e03PTPS_related/PF10131_9/0_75_NODE_292_length_9900_cov_48_311299_g253_i076099228